MGSSQDPDGALQLLHIIDYIVQWARDTFRETILACLARGWEAVERQTPAESTQASSTAGPPQRIDTFPLPSIEQEELFEVVDTVMDDLEVADESDETQREDTPSSEDTEAPDLPEWVTGISDRTGSKKHAIIRYAYLVKFEFVYIRLPETRESLMKMLRHTFAQTPTVDELMARAQELFQIFSSADLKVPLNPHQIWLLRNEWLRSEIDMSFLSSDQSLPAWTWICLDSEFDRQTWHVVRRLWCVSCSTIAAECLIQIIGQTQRISIFSMPDSISLFDQTKDALNSLRCLPSKLSAQAAIQNLSLCLQANSDTAYCGWKIASWDLETIFGPLVSLTRDECIETSNEFFHKHTRLVEILSRPARSEVLQLFGSNFCRLDDAVLLRKPRYWPENTEHWCLLALKEQDPGDRAAIRSKLSVATERSQIYTVQKGRNVSGVIRDSLDEESRQFLRKWKEDLVNSELLCPE